MIKKKFLIINTIKILYICTVMIRNYYQFKNVIIRINVYIYLTMSITYNVIRHHSVTFNRVYLQIKIRIIRKVYTTLLYRCLMSQLLINFYLAFPAHSYLLLFSYQIN